jgi:ATP-dependent DNA helicase PIF1
MRHVDDLCDDCKHRLRKWHRVRDPSVDQIRSLALQELEEMLEQAAKSLTDFNLPATVYRFDNIHGVSRIVAEEKSYDTDRFERSWQEGYQTATQEQQFILDSITTAIYSDKPQLFFIDGPGGTGKTFVENLLLANVRSRDRIALAVASSGIAAILLEGGRTSHSRFKIPLDIHLESLCNVAAQSELANLLRLTDLIVWDEAPAQNRHCMEAVDRTLKDLRQNTCWNLVWRHHDSFCRYSTLKTPLNISGDFRQCLPVIPKASRPQIVASTITHSPFWKDVTVLRLTKNMRLLANAESMTDAELSYANDFANWLLQLGEGKLNGADDDMSVELPQGLPPL